MAVSEPTRSQWDAWPERLMSGFTEDANGCHVWQRAKNNRGYGVIYYEGRLHLAHRAAWLLAHGSLPERPLVLDHLCNNKACINAGHLQVTTSGENIMRAYPRGDAATELRRARSRKACATYRAKIKEGGRHGLV